MMMVDVETLGKESNSVILSMAAIYFKPEDKPTPQELRDSAFFVKFDAKDQIKRLNRKVGRTTMEWWAKQCENVRKKSFNPSSEDVRFEDGYEAMREWAKSKNDDKCWVWARGNLDQLVLDSMEEQLGLDAIWKFARWRDVRTAIDFLYETNRGYCDVDYTGFDPSLHITKHNPIDDCVFDIMMMVYGKNSEKQQ
jgi:hypothetical protein